MERKIEQLDLDIIVSVFEKLAATTFYVPHTYINEVLPFIAKLRALPLANESKDTVAKKNG